MFVIGKSPMHKPTYCATDRIENVSNVSVTDYLMTASHITQEDREASWVGLLNVFLDILTTRISALLHRV